MQYLEQTVKKLYKGLQSNTLQYIHKNKIKKYLTYRKAGKKKRSGRGKKKTN